MTIFSDRSWALVAGCEGSVVIVGGKEAASREASAVYCRVLLRRFACARSVGNYSLVGARQCASFCARALEDESLDVGRSYSRRTALSVLASQTQSCSCSQSVLREAPIGSTRCEAEPAPSHLTASLHTMFRARCSSMAGGPDCFLGADAGSH